VFGLRKFGADTRTNGYYVTLANGKVYWYNQANTPKWQLLGQQFGAGKNISRLVADVGHQWDPANRNDSGYAYLTLDNFGGPQIWQTRDGGLTWQQITGNTYDPGNANPALRYVVQANGLPNVPVQTVVVDQRAGRTTLYAGNVTAVNDAPVNSVPGSQSTNEDTDLVFSSGNSNLISISDVDAGSSSVQVSLSAMYGTLTLSGTTGLTFSMGDGTADGFMTFTGTVANINAALSGLTYTPNANSHNNDTLNISTNDQGNTGTGGSQFDFDSVVITVNSVNDAPTGSDHTVYTMQNTDYFFSAYDFGFSDSADWNGFLAVKITSLPTIGTIWLYDGSTYVAVTANQYISVSDINSGRLQYMPPANTTGSPTFTFRVQDDGGTANGGIDLDLYDRTMTINIS
jgi:hypothetical protein